MWSIRFLLAASAVVAALAMPSRPSSDEKGILQRRSGNAEEWTQFKRQSKADLARYPRADKVNGEYEESQEAADQCYQYNMLRHGYDPVSLPP